MQNLIVMFVTAVCFFFLLKLKWPKNKNFYDVIFLNIVFANCYFHVSFVSKVTLYVVNNLTFGDFTALI